MRIFGSMPLSFLSRYHTLDIVVIGSPVAGFGNTYSLFPLLSKFIRTCILLSDNGKVFGFLDLLFAAGTVHRRFPNSISDHFAFMASILRAPVFNRKSRIEHTNLLESVVSTWTNRLVSSSDKNVSRKLSTGISSMPFNTFSGVKFQAAAREQYLRISTTKWLTYAALRPSACNSLLNFCTSRRPFRGAN